MARPIYQYQPVNEDPDISIGIKLPFNKSIGKRTVDQNYASGATAGGGVFELSYTTEEQALSNFKNLLMTTKGERIMQPNFGTSIRNLIFENNTRELEEFLRDEMNRDIEYWLPYITLSNLEIIREEHTLTAKIHFQITTTGANLVINILASENEMIVSDPIEDTTAGVALTQVSSFGGFGGY
jgi:phage baseplate assembly protein W